MCTFMWPIQRCLGINSLESWRRSVPKKIKIYFSFSKFLSLLLYQNAWSGKDWGGRRPWVLSQPNYSGAGCHISLNSHKDILPFYLLLRDTLQSWSNLFNNIRCSFPLPKIKRARPAECAQKENYCPINLNCDKCYTCDWKPGNTHIIITSCLITWRHQETTS